MSTLSPFQPKGDVAEWRTLYEAMVKLKRDEVFTVERIEELLGRPLGQNRSPIYRAIKELETNDHRTLATVRGVGYRVALPTEHLDLSLSHSARARKQLKRGLQRASSTDLSGLTPSVAARLEAFEATTSRLVEFLGHMSKTVDEQSIKLKEMEEGVATTDERVKTLEDALRKRGLLE